MLKCEVVLIDPSPGEVAERLSEAVAATNAGCRERRLDDSAARWRKFAREATSTAEGWRMWHGGKGPLPASVLNAGWWTDALGRKHIAVRGRRLNRDMSPVWMDRGRLRDRPPVWHCYPDCTFGLDDAWLVACGCGAVGTPAAVAWMGDCCGPCHDRREEFGSLPPSPPAALHAAGWGVMAVAVSEDTAVAAADGDQDIRVWWPDGSRPPFAYRMTGQGPTHTVGFLPDGRLMWAGPPHSYGVNTIDPAADQPTPAVLVSPRNGVCGAVATASGIIVAERSRLVQLDGNGFHTRNDQEQRPTPSADGRYVVLLTDADTAQVFSVGPLTGHRIVPYSGPARDSTVYTGRHRAAYHPPTDSLFLSTGNRLERYDSQTGRVERSQNIGSDQIVEMQLTPGGRTLAAGMESGRVRLFDTDTLETAANLHWHLGRVQALAISPNGHTLVTGGVDGVVKLWPLDRLLPAESA